jgi:hypothetical protein
MPMELHYDIYEGSSLEERELVVQGEWKEG